MPPALPQGAFRGGVASTFTSSVLMNTRLLPAPELSERAGGSRSFRAGLWCHSTPCGLRGGAPLGGQAALPRVTAKPFSSGPIELGFGFGDFTGHSPQVTIHRSRGKQTAGSIYTGTPREFVGSRIASRETSTVAPGTHALAPALLSSSGLLYIIRSKVECNRLTD